MRRATECFSMYSDMSMRTMAFSLSKRNSASALLSSVLPTPVGPRNRKEPMGLFSSCSPARARLTASDTALTACFCPITRAPRRSSMCTSLARSPSCRRAAGMPVQVATTLAMSPSVTSSFSSPPSSFCILLSFSLPSVRARWASGSSP